MSRLLMGTMEHDPDRMAIYEQVFAGTEYEHLVHGASLGDVQI